MGINFPPFPMRGGSERAGGPSGEGRSGPPRDPRPDGRLRVFISYRSEDAEAAAQVRDVLGSVPDIDVWFDRERISPGADVVASINDALSQTDIFVALMGRHVRERWSERELEAAIDMRLSGDLAIVPVAVSSRGTDVQQEINRSHWPPLIMKLPYVDFRTGAADAEARGRLLGALRRSVGELRRQRAEQPHSSDEALNALGLAEDRFALTSFVLAAGRRSGGAPSGGTGSLYLSTSDVDLARDLFSAFTEALALQGVDVTADGPPVLGSWFQRVKLSARHIKDNPAVGDGVEKGVYAAETMTLRAPMSQVNINQAEAIARLAEAADRVDEFLAITDGVMLLKATTPEGRTKTISRTLTVRQIRDLERRPELASDPALMLRYLQDPAGSGPDTLPEALDG